MYPFRPENQAFSGQQPQYPFPGQPYQMTQFNPGLAQVQGGYNGGPPQLMMQQPMHPPPVAPFHAHPSFQHAQPFQAGIPFNQFAQQQMGYIQV
jgi:hypothetical protein